MSYSDAYVRVWCNNLTCPQELEIDLPFVYSGIMHTIGHYDHREDTVNRRVKQHEWIVVGDRHFCCQECQEEFGEDEI